MTRRDCVRRAMMCSLSEVVPWQINFTGVYENDFAKQHPGEDLNALLENHIYMVKYKKNRIIASNLEVDLFGLKWDKSGRDGGDIGLPIDPPLADGEFGEYRFPKIDREFAQMQAAKLEAENAGLFRMYGITFTLYERAWGLRGMEDLLADMLINPTFVHELMERIVEHHLALLDAILPYDFDAIYFGDDWGSQNGLIMGADLWRQLIKPYMRRLCERVKQAGKMVVLHSCGNIMEILDEVIEIGVDCYNTVQPELYDLRRLKALYGKDLCFYGGISNQSFLPYASPTEVEKKCLETMEIMSGGGYILSPTHNLTPDIPLENALAIVRAAKRFSGR